MTLKEIRAARVASQQAAYSHPGWGLRTTPAYDKTMEALRQYMAGKVAGQTDKLEPSKGDVVEVPQLGVGTITQVDLFNEYCLVQFSNSLSAVPVRITFDELREAGKGWSPVARYEPKQRTSDEGFEERNGKELYSEWATERDRLVEQIAKPKRKYYVLTAEKRVVEATPSEWASFWSFSPEKSLVREDIVDGVTVRTEFTPEGKFLVSESTNEAGVYIAHELGDLASAQSAHLSIVRNLR